MNELIFGKDRTERIVGCEPGPNNTCELFIQDQNGSIESKLVPLTHWILYSEKLSSKMQELAGNQPFRYLMEYESLDKFNEVLKGTRSKRIEHFICRDPKEAFMVKNGVTMYKGMKQKDVSVLSFDLEHTYGIGDSLNFSGKLLLISNTFRDSQGNITKRLFAYDDFKNESEMIVTWCNWVREINPSVVVGHNLFGHDFKVLSFAATKNRTYLKLGRNNSYMKFDHRKSMFRKDGSQSYEYHNVQIYGREIVDTFFLAIKYDIGRNYESYGLKQIIKQEKLEKNHRTFYDASQIIKNYQIPEEWEKIKAYAIDDADDALSLYDLMVAPFFYSTMTTPRSFQHLINSASGSQINGMMVRAYLQQGHSIARASEAEPFEGAISFGVPGIHKNVLRFDVASLYPSIIRQYKICPREKDPQELFLKIVNYFTDERLHNKKLAKETGDRYYKDLEQSQKIIINSMYGFMGANRVNYNYPFGAAEVTRYGREILKKAILWATGKEWTGPITSDEVEDESA